MKCADVRDNIAARRSGWLSPEHERALDAHLAGCAECRAQMEADARLCDVLQAVEPMGVRVPAWAQVKAAKATRRPMRRPLWVAPALGTAALAAAALWMMVGRLGNVGTTAIVASDSLDQSARQTHMLLAVSDVGGDPNRAVAVLFEDGEGW